MFNRWEATLLLGNIVGYVIFSVKCPSEAGACRYLLNFWTN